MLSLEDNAVSDVIRYVTYRLLPVSDEWWAFSDGVESITQQQQPSVPVYTN